MHSMQHAPHVLCVGQEVFQGSLITGLSGAGPVVEHRLWLLCTSVQAASASERLIQCLDAR